MPGISSAFLPPRAYHLAAAQPEFSGVIRPERLGPPKEVLGCRYFNTWTDTKMTVSRLLWPMEPALDVSRTPSGMVGKAMCDVCVRILPTLLPLVVVCS